MNSTNVTNYETNFKGRAFVEKDSYHYKNIKKITTQLNKMKFLKNSDADVYISSQFGDNVKIYAKKKGWNIKDIEYKTKEKTVNNPDAIISATKRVITKYNNLINTQSTKNNSKSFIQKIKNFFTNLKITR